MELEHDEKLTKLDRILEEYAGRPGALIPVLHEAQKVYGYLPEEVQYHISQGLGVPLADVYGVVTFYALFTMTPRAEHNISVCMGTACYVKGAGHLVEKIGEDLGLKLGEISDDRRFGLEATRCIGACGMAPVLTVNEEVHGRLNAEQMGELLEKYKQVH
ncbi:complex I 24 kDa subunit family protein [Phosphitispora fastidiosa]|uniref:NADH-quinone oxidoreductase subunit NuoE family protein n=1 Tax=Phosphitispora fastidiosa TaxID=2837202 RepID=UPI001E55A8AA|nr:NAD(P)H-dependent oxidoreductase subunit E [Phosphitispora fastidiosa]MBU7008734.1 NADH:ubiquinone oxidoreductase subunit E [Phosphitispora fastidiosa]